MCSLRMSNLTAVANLFLVIVAVISAIFAGLRYADKEALRKSNSDLRDRVRDLEEGRNEDRAEIAAARAEIAELHSRNEVLTSMVTGEVHWKALAEAQDQFVRDAHKHWRDEHEALDKVLKCLDKVITKMASLT